MPKQYRVFNWAVRQVLKVLCRYDRTAFDGIPEAGPAIIILNHINFLEVPLVGTMLAPREFYALAKKETWENPLLRIFTRPWGGIPVDRQQPELATFRRMHQVLKDGAILCIAPEGTRSGDGMLRRGNPGSAAIAIRSHTMIIPVAFNGNEDFWKNFKRLRRTPVSIRVGRPFVIRQEGRSGKQARQEITDQMMMQLAALLPEENRGEYSDQSQWRDDFLHFLDGAE